VNPTATPGAGSTSGREGEPDGRRHQLGGPRPPDRRWNPKRALKGPAGQALDASGTGSLVDSASPSKLITPRLLSLRAAANYLGVSPWTIRDLETKRVLKRVTVPLPGGTELRKLLFDKEELDRLIDVWRT
jgi:hypothetical protein